jgi:hypothetical protein
MTETSRRKRSFYIYISYIFSLSALLSVLPSQPINILSHGLPLVRRASPRSGEERFCSVLLTCYLQGAFMLQPAK